MIGYRLSFVCGQSVYHQHDRLLAPLHQVLEHHDEEGAPQCAALDLVPASALGGHSNNRVNLLTLTRSLSPRRFAFSSVTPAQRAIGSHAHLIRKEDIRTSLFSSFSQLWIFLFFP